MTTSTTDTGKRLSDAEIEDIADRSRLADLEKDVDGFRNEWTWRVARPAHDDRQALLSHIASINGKG